MIHALQNKSPTSGTGARFQAWVSILAGVAALAATLLTILSIWLQTKNYRKPLLQRYVVRILVMVPIYSIASWVSLQSLRAAFWIDPFRDVYEAFTIYAFFQLLINFIGGERSLIIMMHGRPPVSHPWPLNRCFAKIDISDPHTFLAMKRGILQYTWVKPVLSIATIGMKAAGVYKEGTLEATSGYLWSGIIYNLSITISLYALAMFWVCMAQDLKPFRPMPKFLCIKGIIFASYWQGFFLSILVKIKLIPDDVQGYSPDNLAAAIQDALICFEMPAFAILHWYAFSWHDYADATISSARMPVKYALRDAFGPRDLIEDAKETFAGENYEYRYFDAEDDVIAHEESHQRAARMSQGMRYARGGKGKYWIPQPGKANSKTPLLGTEHEDVDNDSSPERRNGDASGSYGTLDTAEAADPILDVDEEELYANAKALEFGDWHYPVITAHHASRDDQLYHNPNIVTASTNRNLLQPTKDNKRRRKSRVEDIQNEAESSKRRRHPLSQSGPVLEDDAAQAEREQLVDLVVEDSEAEEVDRVRARKSGNPQWNNAESKHFVKTYGEGADAEDVREGFESDEDDMGTMSSALQAKVASDDPTAKKHWKSGNLDDDDRDEASRSEQPLPHEASNVWGSPSG